MDEGAVSRDETRRGERKRERESTKTDVMEGPPLTPNAASALWAGNTDFKPVLQCTDLKQLAPASGKPGTSKRFRVHLSDGTHFMQAMLATQMVEKANQGEFDPGSVVRLDEFLCNTVHNRKIVIVLQSTTLGKRAVQGSPTNVADKGANPQQQQQQHPGQHAAAAPAGAPGQQQYNLGYGRGGPGAMNNGGGGYAQQQGAYGGNPNPHQQQPPRGGGGYNNAGPGAYSSGGGGGGGNQYQNQYQNQQQRPSGYGGGGGGGYGAGDGGGYPPHASGASGGGYGGNRPQPNYAQRGPISRNEAPARIVPIKSLNPYLNRWTIQARVTNKGDLRRWQNSKGEGTVFNFDVVDAEGGEIRLCAFKDACEKFFPLVEVGKVYLISKGALRPARKQYNPLNSDFEVYLETNSTLEPCLEDDNTSAIPTIQFNFKPILSLEQCATGTMADVVGVVLSCDAAVTIQRRDGTDTQKRTVSIKDDSNASIELTLWGSYVQDPGAQLEADLQQGRHPVVAIKAARVGDYQGKTLGTISSTTLLVDPDIPEAGRLRNWYDRMGGANSQTVQLNTGPSARRSRRVTFAQIKDENLGTSGKADYVEVLASIKFIKNEVTSYPACSLQRNGRTCNKKVSPTDEDGGEKAWCETCQQHTQVNHRWMLQFQACDHTQERWLTCFGDVGDEIMGCNANEFKRYENTPDMDHVLGTAQFQRWLFTLKVAEDTYNDETRVKVTVQRVSKPDYRQEGEQRAKDIQDLLQGGGLPTNAHHDGGAYHNQKKPRTHEYGVGGGAGGYGGQAYAAGGGGGGYGGGGYGGGGYGGGGHGGGGYGGSGYGGGGFM